MNKTNNNKVTSVVTRTLDKQFTKCTSVC